MNISAEPGYYQGTPEHPYHLSVGAVVVNEAGEVGCHYFKNFAEDTDVYALPTETVEVGETLEEALMRGLMEECGMRVIIKTYLGSAIGSFRSEYRTTEKTTLYFLCSFIDVDEMKKAEGDYEAGGEWRWFPSKELKRMLKEQYEHRNYGTMDVLKIIDRIG